MSATMSSSVELREHTTASETVVGKGTIHTGTAALGRPVVVALRKPEAKPVLPVGYSSIDDVVSELFSDADGAQALLEARADLAEDIHAIEGMTLRARRLALGLSQAKLAEMIGTQQPHIARIERGTENLHISTCRRLCVALQVDMNDMDKLLERQEQAAMQRVK